MNTELINLSQAWPTLKHIFSVPHSKQEYDNLVDYLDILIDEVGNDEKHELAPVMETLGTLIENYEDRHYEINQGSAINTLAYLMQEHNLKQSDMKEIGSQGVVSEVLSGKRSLNITQIKKISERFRVSPTVFIDYSI